MLFILCYLIANVIIARYLEKKMHVAAIFHCIMFTFICFVMLLMCDNPVISYAFHILLGDKYYHIYQYFSTLSIYNNSITMIGLLELIVVFLYIVILAYASSKVISFIRFKLKKKKCSFSPATFSFNYFVSLFTKMYIYITFCKLRN